MTRLVVFVTICIIFAFITSLSHFKKETISNEKFSYETEKQAYVKKQKEIHDLMNPKVEGKKADEAPKAEVIVLDTPELENGHAIYSKKCVSCHGKQGQGKKGQNAPKLAGQFDWYVTKQIKDMKSGVRENKVMMPYIRKLSEQDMKDLGTYVSKFTW